MNQFVADDPFESLKPELRGFKFEELPPSVRHRIYRELLLIPKYRDDEPAGCYSNEHQELSARTEELMIDIGEEGMYELHPGIMRTNKKIHGEAATVLYGENWFTWSIYGIEDQGPMWAYLDMKKVLPRRYSRLIAKMRVMISVRGGEVNNVPSDPIFWCLFWIATNLQNTCKALSLSDLKTLKVDFYNCLGCDFGGSWRTGYFGERCLEALKKVRAERFVINNHASPRYAAELKTVIEGPKDAAFRAYRQAVEDEPEIHLDESEVSASEGMDSS